MRNPRINKRRIKEAVDTLHERGISKPKVREIAEEAGVSTGTAHRYMGELSEESVPAEIQQEIAAGAELPQFDPSLRLPGEELPEARRPGERTINAKFEGHCSKCYLPIHKGDPALYDPHAPKGQKVRHHPGSCPDEGEFTGEGESQPDDHERSDPPPTEREPKPSKQGEPQPSETPPEPRPDGAGEDDFTPYSYVDAQDGALRESLQKLDVFAAQNFQSIQEHTRQLDAHTVKLQTHETSIDTIGTEVSMQKRALETARSSFDALGTRVTKLEKKVGKLSRGSGGTIKIEVGEVTVELGQGETLHAQAEKAAKILKTLHVLWLCGPTGSGKTHLAAQLATILSARAFAPYSCTQGMTEGQLLGRLGFDNIFLSTPFVDCYENGGLVLLDEYDALNDNVRLVTNSAIANEILSLPNRIDNPIADRHPDFLLVIGTNTWGYGSDDFYTGRDTIDGATQDRFALAKILLDYDPLLETSIPGFEDFDPAPIYEVDSPVKSIPTHAERLPHVLEKIRHNTRTHLMQQEVSTRTKINAAKLRDAGFDTRQILEIFFTGWAAPDVNKAIEGTR